MQLMQKCLTALTCKKFHSTQNSETFDLFYAFLLLVVAKLSDLKGSPAFLAHPVRCVSKKEVTWCLIITLANVYRLSKFFHQLIRKKFSMYTPQ